MIIKYIAAIIGFILGVLSMLVGFHNSAEKIASSKLYKGLVIVLLILFLLLTVKSCMIDEESEKKAELKITRLNNDIDTIKRSLPRYGLTLSDKNKVVNIEGNVTINSENGVAVNNGHVENNYNQSEIDNSQKTIVESVSTTMEKPTVEPEIVLVGLPSIQLENSVLLVAYFVKTKLIEANFVKDEFTWVYKEKGKLFAPNQPANCFKHPGIITHEPRKLVYELVPNDKKIEEIDTCYFLFFLTYKNILGNAQPPIRVLYRASLKGDKHVYKVISSKEYDKVIDFFTMHPPIYDDI